MNQGAVRGVERDAAEKGERAEPGASRSQVAETQQTKPTKGRSKGPDRCRQ